MNIRKNLGRLSVWGLAAATMVISGSLMTNAVIAQSKPLYISGSDVPVAYKAGNPDDAVRRLRLAYNALKLNNWDGHKVPVELLKLPDQKYAEDAFQRDSRTTALAIPDLRLYRKVAFWVDIYERKNIVQYGNRTTSKPEGFWFVMYKDGTLRKVAPQDVRLYPHPTMPDCMIPVFPGMDEYNPSLPRMPYCRD